MGLTLFRYIILDLLRVFLLAILVITGIMSFAGLLRPLTERGLDGGQVISMLAWLTPAMACYSLPVAALFATTFVYGRLAADNEIVAMRAAGIPTGLTGLTLPALVIATAIMAANFGLLSFVVPAANLQVERVVYSNLARLSANEINRTKRLRFNSGNGRITLTADSAVQIDPHTMGDAPGVSERTQIVQLNNVYVMRYDNLGTERDRYEVPSEIFTARRATAFIEPPGHHGAAVFDSALRDDWFMLTVVLEGGLKIPRTFEGTAQAPLLAAVDASQIGPLPLASPVRQNTKFLDLRELRRLYHDPRLSREIGAYLRQLGQRQQRDDFLAQLHRDARGDGARLQAADDRFSLSVVGGTGRVDDDGLTLEAGDAGLIELIQQRPRETLTITAPRLTITAQPLRLAEGPRVLAVFSFSDATVTIDPEDGEPVTTRGRPIERRALFEMPPALAELTEHGEDLISSVAISDSERDYITSRLVKQRNSVYAEIHARVSFAVSCLVLPILGGALGMMFRSGNFLTAFAACVVPALLSISLIVMGQTVAENTPVKLAGGGWNDPMYLALPLIWGGNAVVAAGACALLWRLRRT